jgi:hypothetical protein
MLKIYFACFIAFLNSAINGYDLSLFGGLVALQSFRDSFNNGDSFDNNPNVRIVKYYAQSDKHVICILVDGYHACHFTNWNHCGKFQPHHISLKDTTDSNMF